MAPIADIAAASLAPTAGSPDPPRWIAPLDETAALASAFMLPEPDGRFDPAAFAMARQLSMRRPAVLLAFAPKAAGTFLRTAAITAVDGKLVRTVHAQGERDAQLYAPTFITYYLGKLTPAIMVTHVHMQALTANRHFIEAFDLRPVIMTRPIPDMLASYRDMLESDPAARAEGLNCRIPAGFAAMPRDGQNDFLIDMLGPWYASYFATWLDYADAAPERVCVLDYESFRADPAAALQRALAHSGIVKPIETCREAVAQSWAKRDTMRFNHGVGGRGQGYFSSAQRARLDRMLAYHDLSDARRLMLLGG